MAREFVRISVRGDVQALLRDFDKVRNRVVRQAAAAALNRIAARARTASARALASLKRLRVRDVRRRLLIFRANPSNITVSILALLAQVKASDLGTLRQTSTGAKAGAHTFPGAFVATMKSGHRGVFRRRGRRRLPISAEGVRLQPEAEQIIEAQIKQYQAAHWDRLFNRELAWRLESKGLAA